jgi:hypothetical protein
MTHTLAAVFDNRTDAERAQEELIKAGFSSGTIQLNDAATAAGATSSDDDDDSILGSIKHFFMGLLGREHGDPHVYAEAVHRGHIVLSIDAPTRDEAERAADIIEAFGPLDIDTHEQVWRAGGWTGAESMRSSHAGMQQSAMGAQQSGSTQSSMQAGTQSSQRQDSPQPPPLSPQQIKPASGAPTQSQQGTSGQGSMQRTAPELDDRPGERNPLGGDNVPLQRGGMRIYPRGQADTPNEDTLSILRGDDMNDPDDLYFRSHWQDTFSYSGGTFQEYEPAYRYGLTMSRSTIYHGRPWEDVETELRETWLHSYPESGWDKFKEAVRQGWNRVTHR